MKPTLTPYLIFDGHTAEAMKFYQAILGGELLMQSYGESGMAKTPQQQDRIIHAALKNDLLSFMASDSNPEQPVTFGNNLHMSIVGTDQEILTGFFNKLAQGGKVIMPLDKQFWGDIFGMTIDKFGVHWMINISSQT
jgi:PhnB protein